LLVLVLLLQYTGEGPVWTVSFFRLYRCIGSVSFPASALRRYSDMSYSQKRI